MAKKSNNNALYALAGAAGVGMLAFALWPRDTRYSAAQRQRYQESIDRFQGSDYCAKYPWDEACRDDFGVQDMIDYLDSLPPARPTNPDYQPPGGDNYLEPN